ncbi:hypothetical protein Gogos_021507 [Gossypium gossypioides]|uniref:Uncharacterized protein n=1 Tax=Gossypium gossypioides TaxID=34282 RepID=A0A7J9D4H6_GOSGO|nr:hypothetical protein [Gossypium gossypioides]
MLIPKSTMKLSKTMRSPPNPSPNKRLCIKTRRSSLKRT